MRFIVIDKREPFISDIQTRMIVDERDIELVGVATSANGINTLITETTPDVLVVSDTVFNEQEDWIYPNCKTVGYITTKNAPNVFKNVGIPAYEYVPTSETLLNLLSLGVPNAEKSEPTPISTPTPTPIPSMPIANNIEEDEDDDLPDFSKISAPQVVVEPQKETLVVPITNEPTQVAPQQEVKTVKETINQNTIAKNNLLARSLVQADIETKKKATQVVTVYAAKGGVGKTTISTELATYLSKTSVGRGYLRVCIIDCNIDFGDVLTTLNYNPNGQNLSFWAAEVRERLENGEKAENIVYTKEEIERRLQVTEFGLYGLVAPITHEDSMDINAEETEIIFDNIIKNGDFDFVICDTGNNTRDTSVIALEKANIVLLVVTQDVSTASCNHAFISTMQKINFDTSKIRLVINGIMPYKLTQVSIEELEQMFAYKCVARIKRSPEIIRANNCSEPLVLTDASHPFSVEIKKIVSYLLGQEVDDVGKKNKNPIKNLFKRKGKE